MPESSSPSFEGRESRGALGPYVRATGSHKLVVLLLTVVCAATGLVAAKMRPRTYEATAEMVVSPISFYDTTFLGLPVIRDTGDPTQTLQTAAIVVQTSGAARRLAAHLPGWTPDRVASAVTVEPEGDSNVLGVTASAHSPSLAARIANGYLRAALDERRSRLRAAIDPLLLQLRGQENLVPKGARSADLATRVSELETARTGGDPSISLLQPAVVPRTPIGASAKVIVLLSIIAGLVLGCAAALLLRRLSTRVRDNEAITIMSNGSSRRSASSVRARTPTAGRSGR